MPRPTLHSTDEEREPSGTAVDASRRPNPPRAKSMYEQTRTQQLALQYMSRMLHTADRLETRVRRMLGAPMPMRPRWGEDAPPHAQTPQDAPSSALARNAGRPPMMELSLADQKAAEMMVRLSTPIWARSLHKKLARKLSSPRHRPLDRRRERPMTFEDQDSFAAVSFAEHEHGLTVSAGTCARADATLQLDERNARVLCLYLAYKVEGGELFAPLWDRPVSFPDRDGSGRLTLAEYKDGLLVTVDADTGPKVFVEFDNWSAIALCRYLHYRVEGRALQGIEAN